VVRVSTTPIRAFPLLVRTVLKGFFVPHGLVGLLLFLRHFCPPMLLLRSFLPFRFSYTETSLLVLRRELSFSPRGTPVACHPGSFSFSLPRFTAAAVAVPLRTWWLHFPNGCLFSSAKLGCLFQVPPPQNPWPGVGASCCSPCLNSLVSPLRFPHPILFLPLARTFL